MKRALLVLLALAPWGCSGGGSPTGPSAATPALFVTVTPTPLIGVPAPAGSAFALNLSFKAILQETAGVPADVAFINVTLRALEGADTVFDPELGTVTFPAARIVQLAGTNHIAAFGALRVPLSLNYTLSFNQRRAEIYVAVQALASDGGEIANGVARVEVY